MKTCKCGNIIPNWATIPGEGRKNLQNRTRCLICSPFGEHNRIPENAKQKGDKFICLSCGKEFELDRSKGHRSRKCSSCNIKTRKHKMKQRAVEYKGGTCCKCGYKKCIGALQFHHVSEETKEFSIARAYNRSWESIKKELDKCLLVCANCHAEEHYQSVPC